MAGISCAFCAYCVDESLITREAARELKAAEERAAEQEMSDSSRRLRG